MKIKCGLINDCINFRNKCNCCNHNEILPPRNWYYATYAPTCKFGLKDCINDPAYIKFRNPNHYEELYENIDPEEAAKSPGFICYNCGDVDWKYKEDKNN